MRKAIISLVLMTGLSVWADDLQLQDNAPSSYTVKKGDTLWDISGKFLKKPWRWPEIWHLNRDEIKNPHWIYPGDLIVLDMSGGKPSLRLARGASMAAGGVVKLSPQVRVEGLDGEVVPAIPANVIEPFLSQPIVIQDQQLQASPRIAAGPEGRVVYGLGDFAYAIGLKEAKPGSVWQVYRQGKPLKDPSDPEGKKILAYEAVYAGDVRVDVSSDVSKLKVVKVAQEVLRGDRLIPAPAPELRNYVPHAVQSTMDAQVVSSYGDMAEVGQYYMLVLNKGQKDGLENGHVLAIYKAGREIPAENKGDPVLMTPPERIGEAMVFRIFDNLSYALVLRSTEPIKAGDHMVTP